MPTQILPNLSYSSLPPPGEILLITDHLDSSGEFLLHRILANQLKEIKESRVVVLSFALEFAHWKAIAAKSNINLAQYQSSRSLMFINGLGFSSFSSTFPDEDPPAGLSCPPLFGHDDENRLRSLYTTIDRTLQNSDSFVTDELYQSTSQRTVIIDDISILEATGVPTIDLIHFIRALHALCRSRSASLVVRAHASHISEREVPFDSELLRFLLGICHTYVEVRPLASGRSGTISGEVAVHQGRHSSNENYVTMGRKSAVQYRLTEGGVVFFQRGMGAGVI